VSVGRSEKETLPESERQPQEVFSGKVFKKRYPLVAFVTGMLYKLLEVSLF